MKIVILGSQGNLGSELSFLYRAHQPKQFDRHNIDITKEESVTEALETYRPDVVFNCAAYNDVDAPEADPTLANNVNGYALGHLAKVCKNINAVLVHYSSNYVFSGNNEAGYKEVDIPDPVSSYGKSKLLGETELEKNMENFYLIRTSWLYGGRGKGKESFVEKIITASKGKTELNLVEDEIAHPTYIPDLALATEQLLQQNYPFGIYHITNSGTASWLSWAEQIFQILGKKVKLNPVAGESFKRPAKRPTYGILLNAKFPPLRPWQEALKEYLTTKNS